MNNVPLAILIKAIERVLTIPVLIFANPRRHIDLADQGHAVEGFAGGGVGHGDGVATHSRPAEYTNGLCME